MTRSLPQAATGYQGDVATVQRTVHATPERVFAVLSNGWSYSDWVVGTSHIRDVDPHWPALGSRLHHKAGPWPVSLWDSSEVLAMEDSRRLCLSARLWPLGEAIVDIHLAPSGDHSTRVTMHEGFAQGPLRWLQNKMNDMILHQRNVESLRRLADLAERGRTD
jgi:uncharacterized protein YndB with AHSA1/START domain